ncbi:hypothetical protein Hypma_005957 [Hypsizygus marmoreus]|uniref:Uncharacterized protein n=1 Tax=Hypsizygus marmoreus TaxID=39966 RepID=A0A369KDB7_HYPMA|nr:hypothetical protein Hypma_005957 [Hypsizygus marmoreus]
MVATTVAATVSNVQTHDSEKRRKQTVERAKANHLSRQLQLRLQYAKLKVDHGWQKQNLNEVENLYFHHSHQRPGGPKPYPSPSLVATTHRDPAPYPTTATTHPSQSSLSFKLGPSSLSRSHTSADLEAESPHPEDSYPSKNTHSNSAHTQETFPPDLGPPGYPADSGQMRTLISMDDGKRSATPPILPQHNPPPAPGNSISGHYNIPSSSSSTGVLQRTDTLRTSHSPVPTWNSNSRPHPQPQSTGDNSFSFPSSNLTYDSFWSSHSTSTTGRSFRGSVGNTASFVTTVPSAGAMNALGEPGRRYETVTAGPTSKSPSGTGGSRGGKRRNGARATPGREG